MIQISSCIQVGAILAAILSAALYDSGGWVSVSLGVASFNIILLIILIPFFKFVEAKKICQKRVEMRTARPPLARSYRIVPQATSSWPRTIAFFVADVVLFSNNVVSDFLAYALPARIVHSAAISLTEAVSLFHISSVISLFSALILSFFSVPIKEFGHLKTMAIGNLVYHGGALLAFGATTSLFKFLTSKTQLVIGLVLLGLGEPFHLNLGISSKFSLYERWKLSNGGLGEQASRINNVALNLSSGLGTVLSVLSLSDAGEIPSVAAISGLCVLLTMALLVCNLVR